MGCFCDPKMGNYDKHRTQNGHFTAMQYAVEKKGVRFRATQYNMAMLTKRVTSMEEKYVLCHHSLFGCTLYIILTHVNMYIRQLTIFQFDICTLAQIFKFIEPHLFICKSC